jgi:tetratricopeptide (TPR) repeat protein
LCALLLVCVVPSRAAETLAEKSLKEIVERQKQLFERAEKEGDQLDEARFAGEAKGIASSYDVFIQKNPDFAPGYVAYGVFLGKIDMTKAAVAMLLKANKLDPNIPLVKNQLAKHLAEDGKPLEALPYLTAAIDLAPNEPLYHYHLGQLLLAAREDFLHDGGWTRAALDKSMLEAFQRAEDLAPTDLSLAYQHAKAYYEIDPPRWEEALAVWEKLGGRATTESLRQLVKLQRANVLGKLGRGAEAHALLDQVTDLKLTEEKQRVLDALQAPAPAAK